MPYVNAEARLRLLNEADILGDKIFTPGELNYVFTILALNLATRSKCYESFNAVVGVFESAKQEFYRRAVVPYETEKINQNGDVF